MLSSQAEGRQLTEAGVAALIRGQWLEARALFSRAAEADAASLPARLGPAYACRGAGDRPAALAAVDVVLAQAPQHWRALLLKADLLEAAGDARGAAAFYLHGLRAAPPEGQRSPEMESELSRAQAMLDQRAAAIEQAVRGRLATEAGTGRRFEESLDIMFGHARPCLQQPRRYFFPGLAQQAFFDDREAFPWLDALEAATDDIRAELLAVMGECEAFQPYVQAQPGRPRKRDPMVGNPDWSAYYLWKDGQVVAEHAARCPKTMAALAQVPLSTLPRRSPSVLFSLMRPGAHIPAHHGLVNTRLIGHLPLIVPEGCEFRVGNERREWVEGRAWLFDDSIEHEAWNRSHETRVILLFEVWRPDLKPEERAQVTALFEVIDACGEGGAWDD